MTSEKLLIGCFINIRKICSNTPFYLAHLFNCLLKQSRLANHMVKMVYWSSNWPSKWGGEKQVIPIDSSFLSINKNEKKISSLSEDKSDQIYLVLCWLVENTLGAISVLGLHQIQTCCSVVRHIWNIEPFYHCSPIS